MIDLQNLEPKEKALISCLYFSQLNSDDPNYTEITSKLKKIGNACGIKYSSMKNYQQSYDAMFNNGRKGWGLNVTEADFLNDSHIDTDTKNIYSKYKNTDIEELKEVVDYLLSLESNTGEDKTMDFNAAFTIIQEILNRQNINLNQESYDGLIVKKLASTNTLDANRASGQTHIAITGAQMDIFPTVESLGYTLSDYQEKDDGLKKYYIPQAPIYLYKNNITSLSPEAETNFDFSSDPLKTKTSIIKDRRSGQVDQLQVSFLEKDGEDFVKFRKLLHTNDYLIFLKRFEALEYDCFGIASSNNESNRLEQLNNKFFKISTNTAIDISMLNNSTSNQIQVNTANCDNEIRELKDVSIEIYRYYNNESELLNKVNSLTKNEISALLTDTFSEDKCLNGENNRAATTLRHVLLKALESGKQITNNLIDEIKNAIDENNRQILSQYIKNDSILNTIEARDTTAFGNWNTAYSVCYPFVFQNDSFELVQKDTDKIRDFVISSLKLNDTDLKVWGIRGNRNYGNDRLSLAFYPSVFDGAPKAYQLVIEFYNGKCSVGIYKGAKCKGTINVDSDLWQECNNSTELISELYKLLDKYLALNKGLDENMVIENGNSDDKTEDDSDFYQYKRNDNFKPMQTIYYGAPGTGKSDTVEKIINKEYPDKNNKENYVMRVVFHPDYTYSDFIGCIKPVRKEKLDYEFVAGPFLELLQKAILDTQHNYYLVLEEINRGNAAAIFGDIFQLLDRDVNGESVYSIKNAEMAKWLSKDKRLVSLYNTGEIWLPNNFNILCTMNTADQNVYVLDSAFKRRFNMEYIRINFDSLTDEMKNETAIFAGTKQLNEIFKGSLIENFILKLEEEKKLERNWETFALIVNKIIDNVNEQSGSEQISEDKKLGPFFVTLKDLQNRKVFVNKVLYYLKEDVFKYVDQYFVESYEELYNKYLKESSDLFEMLNSK